MFASSERAPKVKKNEIAIMHYYAELCGIMRNYARKLCGIMHYYAFSGRIALYPDDPRVKSYPCKSEPDGRAVAMLVSNLFRLDATHPYKEGTGHAPLKPGNKPLALFGANSPKYSRLGCYMLVEFWCKRSTLGPLSALFAFSTPTEVDIAFEREWKM